MKTIAALLAFVALLVLAVPVVACPLPGAGQVLYDPLPVAPAGCGITAGASFGTYSSGASFSPAFGLPVQRVPVRVPRRSFAPVGGFAPGYVPTAAFAPVGGLNVNVNSFNQGRRFLRR
jgi:hypothetical protein